MRVRCSRTWGAELKRSARTHAMQMQLGKLCMSVSNCDTWQHRILLSSTNCAMGFTAKMRELGSK
eukprot:6213415-Pleurochrysis_carterae.AAC.2